MQLRSIFKEAATNAPALVFIDEIDAIAAKREDVRPHLSAIIVFCATWLINIYIYHIDREEVEWRTEL